MNVKELIAENETLQQRVKELEDKLVHEKRFKDAIKLNNSKLTIERNELIHENNSLRHDLQEIKELSMYEFADKYCSDAQIESDAHAFARSLGVGL